MIKKLFFAMLAGSMMFAASCEKNLNEGASLDGTSTVAFNISSPEIVTRAYSDGKTATVLQYAVYDAQGNELTDLTEKNGKINGSTTVKLQQALAREHHES